MNQVRHEDPAPYHAVIDVIEEAKAQLLHQLQERRTLVEGERFTAPAASRDYLFLLLADRPQEVFTVLFLDTQHRLLRCEEMFKGTIDSASVYPREVARRALQLNAGAVILGHNHPSGLSEPSDADRQITRRLIDALGLFNIRVLDHIVVGEDTYSFAEKGDMR